MDGLIYKTPVPEEKARQEIQKFLEHFEKEEAIDKIQFFYADIIYDIAYWADFYEPWGRCQKSYLVYEDGSVEEIDGFEFFELQVWKVFEKYPQKLQKAKYIVVAEIEDDSAVIYYTENTTTVQNKVLSIIERTQETRRKAKEIIEKYQKSLLAGS
ncbi:hypothetical protein [Anaerocellum danielii]|uniref:Uncharacterized protein n=1 Tax=Anaerocellum danielii TaxID=1387557 RepID=A0ABZ0TXM2_9FIRM|nr:hypothetical protein [Caldicellulosiruptor danielii]WPX08198.1 hypothetical protein SOJ16_002064 [Caldicellulosiruptor danielii]